MPRPRMIVVAGPPGGGKTTYFPVTAFGVDSFNIDDRCAQILGSYRAISREVRIAVARECERFVRDHIECGRGFAVETTLRTTASIQQAELARRRGLSLLPVTAASRNTVPPRPGSSACCWCETSRKALLSSIASVKLQPDVETGIFGLGE